MHRREALKNVAILMGGALSATTLSVIFDSCNAPSKDSDKLISADHQALITEMVDVILPKTSSPGAKEAGVGPFVAMMIKDCFPAEAQKVFVDGLNDIDKRAEKAHNKKFVELGTSERNKILSEVRDETVKTMAADKEKAEKEKTSGDNASKKEKEKKSYFFAMLRDLTILGFRTSELGATKAFAYVDIPGRYDGCTDMKPGQKLWV
ncbi:twin-arginine translocation pathway signal protein [Pedobacter yulinensis]|uniref:Twin-arginine translocation pathway signal protein n=1 Tax=Pedobacter yulinensis TaxID=2126353 RepID=A0A2T3HPP6_9SPHI|nr:gluconate 2-dehydrogenase subunit 3 family protein [Pedobacter yulinensis]PST84418.1 twin-arginine translocation pathway signal protein [Pedobacter yulinensis]